MDSAEEDLILSLIEADVGPGSGDATALGSPPVGDGAPELSTSASVVLQDVALWNKFSQVTNEMIVTKSGSDHFPVVLESSISFSSIQIRPPRWKLEKADWSIFQLEAMPPPAEGAQTKRPTRPRPTVSGSMGASSSSRLSVVSAASRPRAMFVVLNSLHMYEPRVHLVRVDQRRLRSFPLPETRFIAVTAYQNEQVTALKVRHNPFAKAFLDSRERTDCEPPLGQRSPVAPAGHPRRPWLEERDGAATGVPYTRLHRLVVGSGEYSRAHRCNHTMVLPDSPPSGDKPDVSADVQPALKHPWRQPRVQGTPCGQPWMPTNVPGLRDASHGVVAARAESAAPARQRVAVLRRQFSHAFPYIPTNNVFSAVATSDIQEECCTPCELVGDIGGGYEQCASPAASASPGGSRWSPAVPPS
ncbi:unnamed protein product [Ixodes hexagonus]